MFIRKLARGGSTHSFGIHVAKMAGLPPELINRANEILVQLEDSRTDELGDTTTKVNDLKKNIKIIAIPSEKNHRLSFA